MIVHGTAAARQQQKWNRMFITRKSKQKQFKDSIIKKASENRSTSKKNKNKYENEQISVRKIQCCNDQFEILASREGSRIKVENLISTRHLINFNGKKLIKPRNTSLLRKGDIYSLIHFIFPNASQLSGV